MTRINNDSFGWPYSGGTVEGISGLQDVELVATPELLAGVVPVEEVIERRVDDVLALGNADPEMVWAIKNNGDYVEGGLYRDRGPNSYL